MKTYLFLLMTIMACAANAEQMLKDIRLQVCEKNKPQNAACIEVRAQRAEGGLNPSFISLEQVKIQETHPGQMTKTSEYQRGYYHLKQNYILVWKKTESGRKEERYISLSDVKTEKMEVIR